MKLRRCKVCKRYTLKKEHCKKKTEEAGYKFINPKPAFSGFQKE